MNSSVLVVDDEENLLLLLDEILSKEGYQVKTANSAYEALEFFDQSDIPVAILDIKMYPIDGIALLAEIKKRSPSTHVIMMTGFLTTEAQNSCMKYGATNYQTFGDSETKDRASGSARLISTKFGIFLSARIVETVRIDWPVLTYWVKYLSIVFGILYAVVSGRDAVNTGAVRSLYFVE